MKITGHTNKQSKSQQKLGKQFEIQEKIQNKLKLKGEINKTNLFKVFNLINCLIYGILHEHIRIETRNLFISYYKLIFGSMYDRITANDYLKYNNWAKTYYNYCISWGATMSRYTVLDTKIFVDKQYIQIPIPWYLNKPVTLLHLTKVIFGSIKFVIHYPFIALYFKLKPIKIPRFANFNDYLTKIWQSYNC
jgi:hypothetical protein